VNEKRLTIFLHDPSKTYLEIAFRMEDVGTTLPKVLSILDSLGAKVVAGYLYTDKDYNRGGYWCCFVESEKDAKGFESEIKSIPRVIDVAVSKSVDGFLVDDLCFPVMWNTNERAIIVGQERLTRMTDRLRETFGVAGNMMVYQEGLAFGENLAQDLTGLLGEKFIVEHFPNVMHILTAKGIAYVSEVKQDPDFLRVEIRLKDSCECAGHKSNTHYSEFIRGMISGLVSSFSGRGVKCEEVRCIATGDESCDFVVTPR
jgi:predicted hydrocarbon binding protein